jgi:ATP-dependent protease HslVU (ClpYQ) peptidase subunit
MTCIVGLEDNGEVYVGADSAAADGWEVRQTRQPKVFRRGEFIIGYTTSFRMGQILQHHLEVRLQKQDEPDDAFMVCAFIEAVRDCLKKHGFAKVENNVEEGGAFIVGYHGSVYEVNGDFQVNSMADGFSALGCGGPYALGVMEALKHLGPRERIMEALRIAAHFSGGVCGPFSVIGG